MPLIKFVTYLKYQCIQSSVERRENEVSHAMGIKSSTALSPILSGLYFIYNLSESLLRSQATSSRTKLEDTLYTH